MTAIKAIAQFETSLASGISTSSTTAKLISNLTNDNDGATLPNGDYGFVIDSRNSNREYVIATVNGYDLTFVKRGLSYIDGDTVKAGNLKPHRKGASIKITSFPVLGRMLEIMNGTLPFEGLPKNPASRVISDPRHLIDKEYADNVVSSGIASLKVTDNGGITININNGYFSLNGVLTYYAGASNQSLTNNADNYVELLDGALSINTTAFSNDAMPLAKVTTLSGDITVLTDARAVLGWLDIKPSNGIGRDANGIFVDLATDPGLEFSGGKLRTKVKTAGGITRDANGLSVDSGTTANKVVQLDANAKLPAVDGSQVTGLNWTNGVFTKNTADANGATTTITHGLGRVPKFIKIHATPATNSQYNNTMEGSYNGSTYAYILNNSSVYDSGTTAIIKLAETGSAYQVATVTTINSTQIVLTWAKNASPTTVFACMWEAY